MAQKRRFTLPLILLALAVLAAATSVTMAAAHSSGPKKAGIAFNAIDTVLAGAAFNVDAQVYAFLHLEGIDGESKDAAYNDKIELL